MGLHATLFGVVITALVLVASQGPQVSSPTQRSEFKCEVTKPNDVAAGEEKPARDSYGNREVSVGPFGLWPDGTIEFKPGGAGFVTRSGALGMKFGWMRGVSGELKITGRRLDAEAPPLRSQVPAGYGDRGFQATYLIFPTPGCWEVTGHVGDSSVTFVTKVVKIGDGPGWKLDVP
ncbi:MAG TPA: hypothetical protein VLB68_03070 [Pyrinomonadaceae bacterium]|nr:hypothetical protein [Pyrinomonadaceae bacterium]